MKVFMFQVENIKTDDLVKFLKDTTSANEQELQNAIKGYQLVISEHFFKEMLDSTGNLGLPLSREEIINSFVDDYSNNVREKEKVFDYVIENFGFSVFGYQLIHDKV